MFKFNNIKIKRNINAKLHITKTIIKTLNNIIHTIIFN